MYFTNKLLKMNLDFMKDETWEWYFLPLWWTPTVEEMEKLAAMAEQIRQTTDPEFDYRIKWYWIIISNQEIVAEILWLK